MRLKGLVLSAIVVIAGALLLGACQNVTPQQAKAIVATYQALPAPQRTAIAEKAATYVEVAVTRTESRNQGEDGSRASAVPAGAQCRRASAARWLRR